MKEKSENKKKNGFSALVRIMKETFQGFLDDDVMKLSASLAYATLFSIIPFLSLLITIGVFFHADLTSQLYSELQPILGPDVVEQLKSIIGNAENTHASVFATLLSLGVSIFGATTIFAEMQSSLNTIWGIKAIPKKSWLKYIQTRILSFSLVLVFAFVLLITFVLTQFIESLSDMFMANNPDVAESLVNIVGIIINICVTAFIFVLIFKVLPDAKIKIKDVLIGAIVTTLLFLVGQWGISLYIGIANVGSVYGAAAFMAILITWIYYSAIIIYIGAEFTQAWANEKGSKIYPDEFAVATKIVEIQQEGSLNKQEKK